MASRSRKSGGLNVGDKTDKLSSGQTKINVGQQQIRMANERPRVAPAFRRLNNKDTLKLAAAGTRNVLEGTIQKNRAKAAKAKKAAAKKAKKAKKK